MKTFIIKKKSLISFLGIAFIVLLWFVLGHIVDNGIILPKLEEVFVQLGVLLFKGRTYVILFNSISRLLITIVISLVLSVLLAVLSLSSSNFRSFLSVIVAVIRALPVATIIVILLIIFGGSKSPLIITGFVIFPLQYETIYTSFKTIDKSIIDDVLTISNINFRVIKDIFIPIKAPFILSSIISSIGLGFKVMVMAELFSQPNNTIGKELLYSKEMLEMSNVFAWTIIILLLVLIIEMIVMKLKGYQE